MLALSKPSLSAIGGGRWSVLLSLAGLTFVQLFSGGSVGRWRLENCREMRGGGVSESFDLLGDPIPPGWGKRGRPQHIATEQNRNKVMMLLAFGWSNERIAKALSITAPTLRKSYSRELRYRDEARARLDAGLAFKLLQLAEAGNVAAAKEFRKVLERNDLVMPAAAPKPEKPPKLGKKEQALVDAHAPDQGTPLGELMARRLGMN